MTGKQSFILLVAFIGYLAIGGVIFIYLENGSVESSSYGIDRYQEIKAKLNHWNDSEFRNQSIEDLLHDLLIITTQNPNETETYEYREWNFYDGFFFSLTVVTTIGYGHLAPITQGGQVFCIFYAIFGVPMTGILIAAFGDIFSSVLLRAHERSKSERFNSTLALVVNTIFYLIPGMIVFLALPAVAFAYMEEWTYLESFYFAFITLTTIGFGDYVAGTLRDLDYRWIYQTGIMVWIIFGLGYWAMMLNFIIKAMKSKQFKRFNKTVTRGFRQTQKMTSKAMEEFIHSMNQYSTKITSKSHHTKLKRTRSLPLLHKRHISDSGRCSSDSALMAHPAAPEDDMYFKQQEAHTNTMGFIFQLAKAFAFGDLGGSNTSARSLNSIHTISRHPSLLELLTETIVQAQSRKGSFVDANNRSTFQAFGRLHPTRRSCEIPDLRSQGLGDLPTGGFPLRRRSDFGCYLDIPRSNVVQPPADISVLEEVNELESHETTSSKDNLMSVQSTPPSKQRGTQKLSKNPSLVTSQELNELLVELKHLEHLWTPPAQQPSTNGKLCSGETTHNLSNAPVPVVQITAPEKAYDNYSLINNDDSLTQIPLPTNKEKIIVERTHL